MRHTRRISSTILRTIDFLRTTLHHTAFLEPVVFDGGSGRIMTQVGHLTGYGCTLTFVGGAHLQRAWPSFQQMYGERFHIELPLSIEMEAFVNSLR
jgi:hypothetical protein